MDDREVLDKFFYMLALEITDRLDLYGMIDPDKHTEVQAAVIEVLKEQKEKIKNPLDDDES